MPISELEKKTESLTFLIAAEEMRRLKSKPNEAEMTRLYGFYKQGIHGDIPPTDIYPPPSRTDEEECKKYNAWKTNQGLTTEEAQERYVELAEQLIAKYGRNIVRTKWNSEVWTIDY